MTLRRSQYFICNFQNLLSASDHLLCKTEKRKIFFHCNISPVATDKYSGKDYIYVERAQELKKKAYPKKYKKYKNKKGVSVVKYTYEKLLIKGDSLVSKGKDVSYTVGKK